MLDISFLPVESPDEESILLSAGESEDETPSSRSEFGVEDVDPTDLENRTMRWVNQESESPLVQESEINFVQNLDAEEAMGTDHNILDRKESSDQLQTKKNSNRDLPQSKAETSSTSLNVYPDCDTDTHAQVQTDIQPDTDTRVSVPDVQCVRTRAGRVVKKVNRLIESMVQKPFNLQGVGHNLKRRSGSFLSLGERSILRSILLYFVLWDEETHQLQTRDITVRSYYGVPGIVMFQDDLRLDHPEVFLDPLVGNSQVELMNVSLWTCTR